MEFVLLSAQAAPPAVTYASVKHIFDAKCVGCHNARKAQGAFNASTYEGIMKGGEHGKAVIAKKSAQSRLVKMIKGTLKPKMPKGQPSLSAAEIQKISAWIDAGAKK